MKKHLRALPHVTIIIILLLVILIWTNFYSMSIWISIACFVILILPVVFIHLEYLLKGSGLDVQFIDTGFTIKDGLSQEKFVPYKNISKVEFFKSKNIDELGMPRLPSEHYFYVRVILKPPVKDTLILTSLMTDSNFSNLYSIKEIVVDDAYCLFPSVKYPVVVSRKRHSLCD